MPSLVVGLMRGGSNRDKPPTVDPQPTDGTNGGRRGRIEAL